MRPCFDVLGRDRPGTCSYLWPGFHGDTCAMVLVYFESVQAACSLVSCPDSGSYGMGAAVLVSECQSCQGELTAQECVLYCTMRWFVRYVWVATRSQHGCLVSYC